ncbi:hypothetical protein GOV03_03780 [Candidatus Woesearchaeota archaeon]|nr:hypothetical protein [Candidatus Woesearchaeota archaeon]
MVKDLKDLYGHLVTVYYKKPIKLSDRYPSAPSPEGFMIVGVIGMLKRELGDFLFLEKSIELCTPTRNGREIATREDPAQVVRDRYTNKNDVLEVIVGNADCSPPYSEN